MESSRVSHAVENGVEHTKIMTLDGLPREIIRLNEEMRCYFPEIHSVRLEHGNGSRFFPALIAPPYQSYRDNYDIRVTGQDRVAGHDCQVVQFRPRDNFRFAHQFCADNNSGLLLRAITLGAQEEPVQVATFTEVTIGGAFDAARFKPSYADTPNWHVENVPSSEIDSANSGWVVTNAPPGFRKIGEMRREPQGRIGSMTHLVYSDGLASVSVFIESSDGPPRAPRAETLPSSLSFYSMHTPEQHVTVVGAVPLATVVQIGQSVTNLRSSHP
jgi:sigma-E factor negative regulatory protein RseB